MNQSNRTPLGFVVLALLLAGAFLLNLSLGSAAIPVGDTLGILFGLEPGESSWGYIILEYRLPKAITAVLAGGGLALSGLLMQTLFRNPLAGPFVLGISSGASLGAALLIMGAGVLGGWASFLVSDLTLAVAGSLGSLLVLLVVLAVANRVKDAMALLIVGLMFGSITAALVTVLSSFTQAERLQQFIFWSYGSLGTLGWQQLGWLALAYMLGVACSVALLKGLNALLLGETYAKTLGISIPRLRNVLILAAGILAGAVTAFAGPIAFVGLAVPHLSRLALRTTDHRILVPAVLLMGGILMLVCDTVAQLPYSDYVLPINAITSLVGAPVVIWLLMSRRRMLF